MATTAPKLNRIVVMGAKIESVTGTAESITATEAAMVLENPEWTVDQQTIERQYPGSLGQFKSTHGLQPCTLKFDWRMVDGDTGVPLFISTFFPAFDMTPTGAVYNCSRLESTVTVAEWRDGIKRVGYGMRGDFQLVAVQGQPQFMKCTLMGCYTDEIDEAAPSPITYPSVAPPIVAGATLTYGGYTPQGVQQVTINRGNQLSMREDVTKASGYLGAAISAWKPTVEINPEMTALSTKDWTNLRALEGEAALVFNVGADSGNIFQWAAAAAQIQKTPWGDRDGKLVQNIVAQLNGTNPLSLTLA